MAKDKKKKELNNPYSDFKTADAQYLNKLDEKIATAQKQNKKEFCEFLLCKKQLDLNYIKISQGNHLGNIDLLPASLLSILRNRDYEKMFDGFKKDTQKLAKQLFSEDMNIAQICAVACEFVRLTSSNFDRFDSEEQQSVQSALCQSLSTNAYGLLSFYCGFGDAVDQTHLLAWLISLGLDVKRSISYAECVIDAYGKPICHIVEFNGKLGISYIDYIGVANAYTKKIKKLTGLCEFLDFTDEIDFAKKRVLKVLSQFVPKKLFSQDGNLENAVISLAKDCYSNMSDITASEYNMLCKFDNAIWKFSSLCELLLYSRNIEYEVILDLFDEGQYTLKLKLDSGKFKIFPNKVIGESYELNAPKIYVLNKTSSAASVSESEEDDLFNERIESIGREQDDVLSDMEPLSAAQVLESLNVKFTPTESEGISFQNGAFKFKDDELNEMFSFDSVDFSNASAVDLGKADEEQRMLEMATGQIQEPIKKATSSKKNFFDLLDEMTEKTKKNKARRLQEEYEKLQGSNQLKTQEEIDEERAAYSQQNTNGGNAAANSQNSNAATSPRVDNFANNGKVINKTITLQNAQNSSIPAQNDSIPAQNNNISAQSVADGNSSESKNADTQEQNNAAPKQEVAQGQSSGVVTNNYNNYYIFTGQNGVPNEEANTVSNVQDFAEGNNEEVENLNEEDLSESTQPVGASIFDSIMQFNSYDDVEPKEYEVESETQNEEANADDYAFDFDVDARDRAAIENGDEFEAADLQEEQDDDFIENAQSETIHFDEQVEAPKIFGQPRVEIQPQVVKPIKRAPAVPQSVKAATKPTQEKVEKIEQAENRATKAAVGVKSPQSGAPLAGKQPAGKLAPPKLPPRKPVPKLPKRKQ